MRVEIIKQNLDRATACMITSNLNRGRQKSEFFVLKENKNIFHVVKEVLPNESFDEEREMPENAKKYLKEIIYLKEIEHLSFRAIAERYPFSESTTSRYYDYYKSGCYKLEEGE